MSARGLEPDAFDPDLERRRPVRQLADSLGEISQRLGISDPRRLSRAISAWSDVVGAEVAAQARPAGLREQTLTIAVRDGAWITHLRYLEASILAQLNERAGEAVVEHLQFVVEG